MGSGCLRTRAQMKDDNSDNQGPSKPIPVEVQDAQPEGRYAIDEVKGELTRLTGRLEDVERAQKDAGGSTKDDTKKLEARVTELEQAQTNMLEAIKKLQTDTPPPNLEDTYAKGKHKFDAGDAAGAIDAFTAYLKSPTGKNVEEATFLRGEAYFSLKQYKKAILDYSKITEKFPKSRHMPGALYRIGQSFSELGMRDDAKGFYQELIEKFPKSAEARKAKSKK